MPPRTRGSRATSSAADAAPRETSCCSTPGASLLIAGAARDVAHGIGLAAAALDSGAAAATLGRLTELSNAAPEAA